jgi:hypothetical protein
LPRKGEAVVSGGVAVSPPPGAADGKALSSGAKPAYIPELVSGLTALSPFSLLLAVFLLFTGSAAACAGGTTVEQLRSEAPAPDARIAHKPLAFLVSEYKVHSRAEETGRDFGKSNAKAVCPAQPDHDPLISARRVGTLADASHPAPFPFGISQPRGPPGLTTQHRLA